MKMLLAVAALAACSKSSENPKQGPAADRAAAPAPTPTDESGLLADLPTIDKVDCAKVLPQSLVDRFFPHAKASADALDNICDVDFGDDELIVEYQCNLPLTDDDAKSPLPGMTAVAGLGRAAYESAGQLEAFDTDTACVVTASYTKKPAKLVDFLRAALDAVSP